MSELDGVLSAPWPLRQANGAIGIASGLCVAQSRFLEGFVSVTAAAAAGDLRPRDEYLASVIPAIRDGGMPLDEVLDGMVRVAVVTAAVLDREHLPWVAGFCADYTRELLRVWDNR